MFGQHAVKAPLNFIAQPPDGDHFAGVCQSMMPQHPLLFGRKDQHLLVLGDCVFRPHIIAASQHLIGSGIASIYMSGFDMQEWAQRGSVLFDINQGGWLKSSS